MEALGELQFPATMSDAEQRAEVKRQVESWLDAQPDDERFGAKLPVNGGDYDPQTPDDTRSLEYSREETRVVDGEAQVATAVDRPLQHVRPWFSAACSACTV